MGKGFNPAAHDTWHKPSVLHKDDSKQGGKRAPPGGPEGKEAVLTQ